MKHTPKVRKEVPVYQIVQQILNTRQDKKECARVAARIKYRVSCETLSKSLDSLFKVSSNYKELLWGNLFPKDVDSLGEGNGHFFRSENIFGDFNWLYVLISVPLKLGRVKY